MWKWFDSQLSHKIENEFSPTENKLKKSLVLAVFVCIAIPCSVHIMISFTQFLLLSNPSCCTVLTIVCYVWNWIVVCHEVCHHYLCTLFASSCAFNFNLPISNSLSCSSLSARFCIIVKEMKFLKVNSSLSYRREDDFFVNLYESWGSRESIQLTSFFAITQSISPPWVLFGLFSDCVYLEEKFMTIDVGILSLSTGELSSLSTGGLLFTNEFSSLLS